MPAPIILVTNDDGIDSHFLRVLVEALQKAGYDTRVAAPLGEQSWISRALSRRRDVHLAEFNGFNCPAWTIDGTPTDCVNIALGHLLPEPPAAVVSGINLSTNAGLPHILASGTVAGALEGAFWGLPALAFSMELPRDRLAEIRHTHGNIGGTLGESLLCAAGRAADFTRERLAQTHPDPAPTVHNFNFPIVTTSVTPVVRTRPANLRLGTLFARESPACFTFRYQDAMTTDPTPDNDHAAIARGCISHSVLDYGFLGA
ncbi:MAG TPA: 5'/3'-nucleotidase SurE [Opitutales bacterium]|jgi:5'-nucleotidase|nr:5'/3'-nucleotidase SurE [Opitutales bacterium]